MHEVPQGCVVTATQNHDVMRASTLFTRLHERLQADRENGGVRFSPVVRGFVLAATVLACGVFFPWWIEETPPQWQPRQELVGTRWRGPLVRAEYSFVVAKPRAIYEQELRRALDSVVPLFQWRPVAGEELSRRVEELVDSLRHGLLPLPPESASLWGGLPEQARSEELRRLQEALVRALSSVFQQGILNVPKEQLASQQIAIRRSPVVESRVPVEKVLDTAEALALVRSWLQQRVSPPLQAVGMEIASRVLRPTLYYDGELTRSIRHAAQQGVPRTWGIVRAGEIVIAPGDVVTDTTIAKLQSYGNARLLQRERRVTVLSLLGGIGQAALICAVLFVYLGFFRPRIFRDNLQLSGLALGLVLIAAMAWISRVAGSAAPIEHLVLVPALSMLVAILLDSRTAFYATVTAALLVAGIRLGDYPTGLSLMLGGMMAAYTVRDLESRRQLFRSLFFTALGMGVAVLIFGLAQGRELQDVLLRCGFAGVNAAVSPVLTFGVLLLLERVFNLVTDMRLLEYSSLEHPLLRELQHKAPGTYQHTLNVAHLAERAARAIGARALLVRVGAYFHDIGKLMKPEYFAENLIGLENKHERLPPKKSAAIIREHVTEGIELARAYNLPPQIVDFIPQHHGTMLIRAFWQKALEQARNRNEPPPPEEEFRYPGPKPQTKEAAILMLADAAEALTHVLPPDEPERLAAALDEVIRERILDGQLDECPLSFSELRRVRDALLEGMLGIQHRRVAYEDNLAARTQPAS